MVLTVERNHEGAYVISDLDADGYLMTRRYYGYTKREAVLMFKAELREWNESGMTHG